MASGGQSDRAPSEIDLTRALSVEPLHWSVEAELRLPGSKSVANRSLIVAALAAHELVIEGATPCDDVRYMVAGLRTLGFEAAFEDELAGRVRVGPRAADAPQVGELFCGNAGTAMRFLISLAAVIPGSWTLDGDEHMRKRPVGPLVDAWRQLGVEIESTNGCPPVRVVGGTSGGGRVSLDASISSQYLSSLMLVGSQLKLGLDIRFNGAVSSIEYARLTAQLLAEFEVRAQFTDEGVQVPPCAVSAPPIIQVTGDWSAMGAWTCLAEMTDSTIRGTNLRADSGQADEHLQRGIEALRGSGSRELSVAAFPDQFMNLAVLAARRIGSTRLFDAANLRVKECDRIAVTARELRRLGVEVSEFADGLLIEGSRHLGTGRIDPEGDHRIAMAFALAGSMTGGIEIDDPGCVAKSYPGFWRDLERVRDSTRCVSIVGMRGAGKTTLARELAQRTCREWVDTDVELVREHGPIASLVETHGWEHFRDLEAEVVRRSMLDGRVGRIVSLGGGAIERAESFDLVRTHSLPLWLDTPLPLLHARVSADSEARPSLTGRAVLDELSEVKEARDATYLAIAMHRLDGSVAIDALLETTLKEVAALARWGEGEA
ncbi:MAG: 3-phosphoshikimate 1-carboxyvinyltransferase [Planctomycetota bacterium]|jgi:3-phosphoshikimate 1-carboxyvinyltransferase